MSWKPEAGCEPVRLRAADNSQVPRRRRTLGRYGVRLVDRVPQRQNGLRDFDRQPGQRLHVGRGHRVWLGNQSDLGNCGRKVGAACACSGGRTEGSLNGWPLRWRGRNHVRLRNCNPSPQQISYDEGRAKRLFAGGRFLAVRDSVQHVNQRRSAGETGQFRQVRMRHP